MWKSGVKTDYIHFLKARWIKAISIVCILVSTSIVTVAQRPQYNITASLDTTTHTVTGSIDITYTNLSSKPLTSLGIHLWPNAYSNKNTAFAKQMLNQGNLLFQRARNADLGGISDLQFSSSGMDVPLMIDSVNIDIAWLVLNEPLLPGASIHLESPYKLKVPVSWSRLGRTGEAYQLTQWYPHIAVLDQDGWHLFPYLEQGEYYNDFADYNVTIEAPTGYTVASTGTLTSVTGLNNKTIWTCYAENVIDFAWYASPTFRHEIYKIDVGGDRPVELNLYIDSLGNELWDSAAVYGLRALKYYSDWLGPYPYPQMSIVYAPLSEGGYMEYPMVAQINYTSDRALLDIAIAHEIGHTWLYGVLASDERTHPWMDEGLNSFIERRYTQDYYPSYEEQYFSHALDSRRSMNQQDAFQHITRFDHDLQPPETDPQFQKSDQYLFSAYIFPPQGLELMMAMKGKEMMKRMFRQYFTDRQFTHVSPMALRQSFEKACDCNLKWFFEDWINHAHEVDYRIKNFNDQDNEVTLVNKGNVEIPVRINSYQDGKPLAEDWQDGFSGEKTIKLNGKTDEVHIYDDFQAINHQWSGNIKPEKLLPHISILPKIGSYQVPILSITPFFGRNITDGFMPGIAFTSGLLPQQHVKFVVAPMYGIDSKQWRGHAEVRYIGDFAHGPFDKFLLSLAVDDFGYNLDTDYLFRDHYVRWAPIVALRVDPDDIHSHITQWWQYRYVHIDQFYGRGVNIDEKIYVNEHRQYGVQEISYKRSSDVVLRPYTATATLQAGEGFLRLNLRYKQHFTGRDKYHGVWLQGFGGWLPVYDEPTANVKFMFNGMASDGFFSRDYMYDEWLPGRNATGGLYAHQVFEKDANLKTLTTIGFGDQWMVGGGLSAALPFRFIHAYMDAALYPSSLTEMTDLSYSGGLSIVLWKDIFEIYIPLLESQDIRESLTYVERDRWFERISFQANFKLANPLNIVDHYQLGY